MGGPQGDRPATGTSKHRHAARGRGTDPALIDAGRFLHYELGDRVALGAVGEIFAATDTRLGRPVALKLLPVEAGSDREFVDRFQRDMPVIAGLDEPHLPPIHDFGFRGGRLYLAMPLLEGTDLRSLLGTTGPLPPGRALAIAEQVAAAVDAVHAAGLVHGDVSTSTIHVAPDDVAYLLDTGLTPLLGVTPTSLTANAGGGADLGCVAPERLTGRSVDGRSDVYSLACVLVECLTGAPLYAVEDLPSLVHAHLYRDGTDDRLEGMPPALRDVLRRGLAKRPEDRFATAGELVAAVRLALGDEERLLPARPPVVGPPPRGTRDRWLPRTPVAAAVVAALVVLAVVAALVVAGRDDPPVEASSSNRSPTTEATTPSAEATGTAGHQHPTEAATAPADSVAEPRIERQVKVGRAPHEVVVSADGSRAYIADPAAGKVYVWDTDEEEPSSSIRIPQGPPQMVSLSPDDDRLYVSVFDEDYTVNEIVVIDTAARKVLSSVPVGKGPYAAETTRDGTLLYVPLFEEPFVDVVDTRSGKVVDRIRGAANPHWMAFAENGRIAYTANHFSDVVTVLDLRTNRPLREIPVGDGPHCVELSPDGTRLAVADYIGGDVSIIDTARNRVVTTVANVGAGPQDVTYAPDGRHLYTANVDDGTVSVIDTETYEVTERIRTGTSPTSVAVLPDGTTALVSNFENGTVTVLQTAAG